MAEEFIDSQGLNTLVETIFAGEVTEEAMVQALAGLDAALAYVSGMLEVIKSPALFTMIVSFVDSPRRIAAASLRIIDKVCRHGPLAYPLLTKAFEHAATSFVEPLTLDNILYWIESVSLGL